MAVEPSDCPSCQSHDVRMLYSDVGLTSYRCHNCTRIFHVTGDCPTRARVHRDPPEAELPEREPATE